jgi:hypothetical protein
MKNHMYNEIHEQPEVLATILEEGGWRGPHPA